jgi:hypothetical protein
MPGAHGGEGVLYAVKNAHPARETGRAELERYSAF